MKQVILSDDILSRFIQMYIDGAPYLICMTTEEHPIILATALHEFKILPMTKYGGPLPSGDRYGIVGAGFCANLGAEHSLRGNSSFYGLTPNAGHLNELASLIPQGISITIDQKVR